MKKILLPLLLTSFFFQSFSQENSATSYCYGSNTGAWLQLDEVLAGISWLGNSERIELELSGGNYGDFGRGTNRITQKRVTILFRLVNFIR